METLEKLYLSKIPLRGGSYQGEWKSCKRHGHGKMIYPDNRVYEGDWILDKRHGFGTLTYPQNKRGHIRQFAGLS